METSSLMLGRRHPDAPYLSVPGSAYERRVPTWLRKGVSVRVVRALMAAAALAGIGVIFAPGCDATGKATWSCDVSDPNTGENLYYDRKYSDMDWGDAMNYVQKDAKKEFNLPEYNYSLTVTCYYVPED